MKGKRTMSMEAIFNKFVNCGNLRDKSTSFFLFSIVVTLTFSFFIVRCYTILTTPIQMSYNSTNYIDKFLENLFQCQYCSICDNFHVFLNQLGTLFGGANRSLCKTQDCDYTKMLGCRLLLSGNNNIFLIFHCL